MRTTLATLLGASLLTILTACALLTTSPASPAHDPSLVACKSFSLITWAPGDDRMALAILQEVRDGKRDLTKLDVVDGTLAQLREVLGDTTGTIQEIKPHNAAYRALCPNGPPAASDSPPPSAFFLEPQMHAVSDER